MKDLSICCHCGIVRGVLLGVLENTGNRVVCYCDDCQAFANYLSTDKGILDTHGGTDIFQVSSNRLKITQGTDHLACVRVTPKGGLRWYTNCCRTPIGNTLPTIKFPFIGLIHSCIDTEDRSLDEVLGPVRIRVMSQYAKGDMTGIDAYQRFPLHHLAYMIWKLIWWRMQGDYKETPLFNPETGDPIAVPQVMGRIEK